ncbi:hypothetical protein INR49_015348 [Caranx melampygus]|nr:hypothetical protein INR49_015348 [Caranx melampygus]
MDIFVVEPCRHAADWIVSCCGSSKKDMTTPGWLNAGQLGVGALTDVALVGPLAGVQAHVVAQRGRLAETAVAEAAHERLLRELKPRWQMTQRMRPAVVVEEEEEEEEEEGEHEEVPSHEWESSGRGKKEEGDDLKPSLCECDSVGADALGCTVYPG